MDEFRLDERVILITGASGHLGREIALLAARLGSEVVLSGRNTEALDNLRVEIAQAGGRAKTLLLDICDDDSVERAIQWLTAEYPVLHGIVNNAYSGIAGPPEAIAREEFLSAFQQNLLAPMRLVIGTSELLSKASHRHAGGASVVNVASMYGAVSPDPRIYQPGQNNPIHYGAAKAAMIQMTRYLACHLAPKGIRVNAVSPGPFPRPDDRVGAEGFYQSLESKVPLGRIGSAHEVAGPVAFLLSAAASYITGANLAVDGGWTAW